MEWVTLIVALLTGAGAGTGLTYTIMKNRPPKVIETNKVVEKMVEVDLSFTDTDLLKVPCSLEYLEKKGPALCRELFCRMSTRGGATQQTATSKECEAIGNILNKELIYTICHERIKKQDLAGPEFDKAERECIAFFDRRI